MAIKIKNVTYTYSPGTPWEFTALNNINLCFNEGTVSGLVGGIGSGKSTLASLIAGLDTPTSGHISIDGEPPRPGRNVGILFQQPEYLFFHNTVFDDMAFGLNNIGVPEHEIIIRIRSVMDKLGLDNNVLDMPLYRLSRGTQRLAALASVLAMKTQYLVLDEPTANIDPKSTKKILEIIKKISQETAVIIISHQIRETAAVSDRMNVLEDGRILFTGSKDRYKQWAYKEKRYDYLTVIDSIMYGLKDLGMDIDTDAANPDAAAYNIRRSLSGYDK
jgi:energy-coupling factor transport system ATP-binding protein